MIPRSSSPFQKHLARYSNKVHQWFILHDDADLRSWARLHNVATTITWKQRLFPVLEEIREPINETSSDTQTSILESMSFYQQRDYCINEQSHAFSMQPYSFLSSMVWLCFSTAMSRFRPTGRGKDLVTDWMAQREMIERIRYECIWCESDIGLLHQGCTLCSLNRRSLGNEVEWTSIEGQLLRSPGSIRNGRVYVW